MDPEMIAKLENEINTITGGLENNIKQLGERIDDFRKIRKNVEPEKKEQSFDSFERDLMAIKEGMERQILKIQNESRKVVRNLVADAHKKEIAEINRIRLESYKEPKAPKYISTIGTALIAAGGAIFSSTFFLTNNFDAAFPPFGLIFIVGLILILFSVIRMIRYDNEIKNFHEILLIEPFEDIEPLEKG